MLGFLPGYWEEGVLSCGPLYCKSHLSRVTREQSIRSGMEEESLAKQLEDSRVDRKGGELPGTKEVGISASLLGRPQCRCCGHQAYHPGGSQLSLA